MRLDLANAIYSDAMFYSVSAHDNRDTLALRDANGAIQMRYIVGPSSKK